MAPYLGSSRLGRTTEVPGSKARHLACLHRDAMAFHHQVRPR
jgi:hypothetical protein